VSARAGDDVVLVVLDANAPGVARAQRRMADGTVACDLSFVDVEIGDSAIVARGAVADAAIARSIKEGALVISAQLVGIARGAMDIALGYLRQREQFGKPIGSFQALQHRAVDLLLQIEVADAAWHNAARRYTENPDAGSTIAAVSAAKARCSEVALAVSRAAIQFHGAIGYTDEADIGLFLKAAMRLAPMLGSVSRHRHRFFDVSFHGSNKELAA
jgi:alkylation response protein AidB-like acyl-CoA dehydrogenase